MTKGRLSIVDNPQIYDLFYEDQTDDIDFYMRQTRKMTGSVLELCCGSGRITLPLKKAGCEITGLDISEDMLSVAEDKALTNNLAIDFELGDATDFMLGRQFQTVLLPFNALLLFYENEQIDAFFSCLHKHLVNGGFFLFDIFNPSLNTLAPALKKRKRAGEFRHPKNGDAVYVDYETAYNDTTQINCVTLYYSDKTGKELGQDTLTLRCFYPQEIDFRLRTYGFEIIQKFGGFDKSDFIAGSPKQVFICRKKG